MFHFTFGESSFWENESSKNGKDFPVFVFESFATQEIREKKETGKERSTLNFENSKWSGNFIRAGNSILKSVATQETNLKKKRLTTQKVERKKDKGKRL